MTKARNSYLEDEKQGYIDHMKRIEGGKILEATAVIEVDENNGGYGEVFPVLLVKGTNGRTYQVEILCDPEGNGPGHPDIHEINGDGDET